MCTRVFNYFENKSTNVDKSNYAITGKNTDWKYPMDTQLFVNPEGVIKQGISHSLLNYMNGELSESLQIKPQDVLTWCSKYQSICYYIYGQLPKPQQAAQPYRDVEFCAMDGMNEKGLAVSVLADADSSFKPLQQAGKNKIATIRFSQFLLDSFATVTEAVSYLEVHSLFLFDTGVPNKANRPAKFHYALSDPSGDNAILEVNNGKITIYHDSNYTVMTNQPNYDVQLKIMDYWHYQWQPSEEKAEPKLMSVPGSTTSVQRFERASYYLHFTKPAAASDAIAQTKGIMATVATPMQFSLHGDDDAHAYTIWTTLCDQVNLRYYFQPSQTMNSLYLDINSVPKVQSYYVQLVTENDNQFIFNMSSGDISQQLQIASFTPFAV